jgi:hypothetical protein
MVTTKLKHDLVKEDSYVQGEIVRNRIFASTLTGKVYFVPKAKRLSASGFQVVGRKVETTETFETLMRAALMLAEAQGITVLIKYPRKRKAATKRKVKP